MSADFSMGVPFPVGLARVSKQQLQHVRQALGIHNKYQPERVGSSDFVELLGQMISILRRGAAAGYAKITDLESFLPKLLDRVRERMKDSVHAVGKNPRDKTDSILLCRISLPGTAVYFIFAGKSSKNLVT